MGRYQQTRTNTIAIKAFDTSGLVWGCMCATGRARCYLVSVLMRQAIAVLGQPNGRHWGWQAANSLQQLLTACFLLTASMLCVSAARCAWLNRSAGTAGHLDKYLCSMLAFGLW